MTGNHLDRVSETALYTLRARVIEARKVNPLLKDPVGIRLFEGICSLLPGEKRERIMEAQLPRTLVNHLCLRARQYDRYTREFKETNERYLVVSLGSGFDTRYWRISNNIWNYLELDLPGVMRLKEQVLGEAITYPVIPVSVLDHRWLEKVRSLQTRHVLFLAEGLFMYLPQKEVRAIFRILSDTFTKSQMVFEVVHARYTRGIWKKMVESKMRRRLGSGAGSDYQFGVRDVREVEEYGENIRVVDEWSYFQDRDIHPKILRLFRHFRFLSRTQWTIRIAIG